MLPKDLAFPFQVHFCEENKLNSNIIYYKSFVLADEPGIVWVAFHLKLNDKFHGLESGDRKDIARSKNGKWTYEDNKVELKFGDVVYYWVQIVHHPAGGKSVDYNLIDQEYQVAGKIIISSFLHFT